MPRIGRWTTLAAGTIVALGVSAPARADIVRLTNGRIMTVEVARFEGDVVILEMRGGGEIRAPKDLVAELLPDEVPFAHTVAIEALAASPAAAAPLSESAIRALIHKVAARLNFDEKLAHAVIRVESNYKQTAISSKGAMGLMQIMPVVVRQYGVSDPFDPEKNLEAGMRYLQDLREQFPRDLRRALAAYNAGASAVVKYGGVPPYRETQQYVARVMALLQ